MADIEQAIREYLVADAGVAALVVARIYQGMAPKSAGILDRITFAQVSGEDVQSTQGLAGLDIARFQFDCWSSGATTCRTLADALRTALAGFRGTRSGIVVRACLSLDSGDFSFEEPYDASQTGMFRFRKDYRIAYRYTPVNWA